MGVQNFSSPGVSAREIDLTGPTAVVPTGVPAGIISPSQKGPAFVPTVLPTANDFVVVFGQPIEGFRNGPLAATEWLRNASSVMFMRVLGAGDGTQRVASGNSKGKVTNAGFVVGDQQPQSSLSGALGASALANAPGIPGRTFFLGCFMSQSAGSNYFTDAGITASCVPLVRGILMAASGVVLTLSSSHQTVSAAPSTTLVATNTTLNGAFTGSVTLSSGKQEFVMLLNGHKGSDPSYPNVITASFDVSVPNYFGRIFNKDPYKLETAGYVLYSQYDIHATVAVPTGSGYVPVVSGANAAGQGGRERIAFLLTGSQTRNSGSTISPNFENFEDRYRAASSPMIVSQRFGGNAINLFKVWSLDDGAYPNEKIKISIENIVPSNNDINRYGTFDLIVRSLTDTDTNKVVLEQWRALSLDPSSPRFIAKVIGDYNTFFNFDVSLGSQKLETTGRFPNQSRYIRIECPDALYDGGIDPTALPMGFRGHPHLVTSGTAVFSAFDDTTTFNPNFNLTNPFYKVQQPPVPMRLNLTRGQSPTQTIERSFYWGVQFELQTSSVEPNASLIPNESIKSYAKYFPVFNTEWANVVTSSNEGALDTSANGILDADRFNNNFFSLEKVRVKYVSSSNLADTNNIDQWSYVRAGGIATDTTNFFKALSVSDLTDPTVRSLAKFSLFLQGGYDGVRIFNQEASRLTNVAVTEEMSNTNRLLSSGPTVSSYIKALGIMGDTTEVDIQLLTLPGVRHRYVTDNAIRTTEERFDAMYLMDIEERDINNNSVSLETQTISVTNTANDFRGRGLNSSFAAAYFPDVMLRDDFNRTTTRVPPTVAVLGAYSKNDTIGFSWSAPMGYERTVLNNVNSTAVRLTRTNMDALYAVDINPIASFAGSNGVVLWGQKTVLARESALERINVRRLLLAIRRDVKRVSNRIVFQPSTEETLALFSQQVTPILKRVQDQNGVNSFKIQIDTSTTTQADLENKTIRGKIWLVPTRTLEFVSLDFVVTNQGTFASG